MINLKFVLQSRAAGYWFMSNHLRAADSQTAVLPEDVLVTHKNY